MTKTEIKQNIHSLVDTVDDEAVLEQIKEMVEYMATEGVVNWNSLSEAERKSVEKRIEQLNRGEKIDYEDIRKQYPEWLRK